MTRTGDLACSPYSKLKTSICGWTSVYATLALRYSLDEHLAGNARVCGLIEGLGAAAVNQMKTCLGFGSR